MINWTKLRSEGGIEANFEQLCAIVARLQKPSFGTDLKVNGNPDDGVDSYWTLENSDIHAWQAKFFTKMNPSRWSQINNSVKKAIKNYPKLTKYIICLPMDLPNSGENSARKTWEGYIKKWSQLKPNVEYVFYGHSEFVNLLSNDKYVGTIKYFFGGIGFTKDWLDSQKNKIRPAIGLRYSGEFNVDLPIIKTFDALCKTDEFIKNLRTFVDDIKNDLKSFNDLFNQNDLNFKNYNNGIANLITKIYAVNTKINQNIEIDNLIKNCDSLINDLKMHSMKIIPLDGSNISHLPVHNNENSKDFFEIRRKLIHFESLLSKLSNLKDFLNKITCVDTRQLMVTGDAGMGKTHLFFDILEKRLKNNQTTILLLGQWFDNSDPLNQIPKQLGLDCNLEDFLNALNSHAQSTNHRPLLMIDALNESSDETIWQKYLKSLSEIISKYDSISFAISARSGYIKKYDDIVPNKCVNIIHEGFHDDPKKYVDIFFTKNNLTSPNMPFLRKEFSNPQFLVLLCKAMKENQIQNISEHSLDILSVYELYIKSINDKLCNPDKLDYDKNDLIVKKGINALVKLMKDRSLLELDYDIANNCLLQIFPSRGYSKSLLYHLLQEGILLRNYVANRTDNDKIRFVYERLAEHLIVREYLNELDSNNVKRSFCNHDKLFKFFNGDNFYYNNSGIIDAILIQFPDKFGKELIEIIPTKIKNNSSITTAILQSLPLRKSVNITTKTISSLLKISNYNNNHDLFNTLLMLSTRTNSDINANYLHKKLFAMKMVDRDRTWSIFLHYYHDKIIKKYIQWAQNTNHDVDSKDHTYLSAITMCWFLTSSHKIIRDNTIIGLIELMYNNAEQWLNILKKFENCNDPYVITNLYVITYAIILKNTNTSQIEKIAIYIYSKTFEQDIPPPDILIRDYARRIINYANTIIPNLSIIQSKIDPPYENTPLILPTRNKLKLLSNKLKPKTKFNDHTSQDRGMFALVHSLSDMGDFLRYTLGTNSDSFEWYDVKLTCGKSIINVVETFFNNLSVPNELLYEYIKNMELKYDSIIYNSPPNHKYKINRKINYNRKKIKDMLSPHELNIFNKVIDPYLNMKYLNPRNKTEPLEFDLHKLRNWISNKIIQFGWKKEYFGEFDYFINRNYTDNFSTKYERMGKKYQWLAYNELLSKISDKYEFKSNGSNIYEKYFGTWQIDHLQTMDPTWIHKKNKNDDMEIKSKNWFPNTQCYSNIIDHSKWLKNKTDMPDVHKILQIIDPDESEEWLTLHGKYTRTYTIKKDDGVINRELFLTVNSYLCHKNDTEKILKYFNDTKNTIKRFNVSYDTYLGELYWHESINEKYDDVDWFRCDDRSQYMPAELYPTTYGLAQESILTYNLDTNMTILVPNKLLFEKMNLINNLDGRFLDNDKKIIVFNTIFDNGKKCLLINKEKFLNFLKENNYDIIWQLWGEKKMNFSDIKIIKPYIWMNLDGLYSMSSNNIRGELIYTFKETA